MAFFPPMLNAYNVNLLDILISLILLTISVASYLKNPHLYLVVKLLIIVFSLVLVVFMSLFLMRPLNFLMKQSHIVLHLMAPLNFIVAHSFKIAMTFTMEITPFVFVVFKNTFLHSCVFVNFSFVLNILVNPPLAANVTFTIIKPKRLYCP